MHCQSSCGMWAESITGCTQENMVKMIIDMSMSWEDLTTSALRCQMLCKKPNNLGEKSLAVMRVAKTVQHIDRELISSPGHIKMTTVYSISRQFIEKEM